MTELELKEKELALEEKKMAHAIEVFNKQYEISKNTDLLNKHQALMQTFSMAIQIKDDAWCNELQMAIKESISRISPKVLTF